MLPFCVTNPAKSACVVVMCVQGCGNTKFVVRGSREGLGYGPAEQEWQPLEQRINQMVFIGRGLDREVSKRGCWKGPGAATCGSLVTQEVATRRD